MAKKKPKSVWVGEFEPALNLTPLLDVIFNLIFFFILATTIKESQAFLDVALPYSEQAQLGEEKSAHTLIITVKENNEVFLRETKVEINALPGELKKIKEGERIDDVIVRGDAKAYHQTIVRVLDACAAAKLFKVAVEVRPTIP